MREEICFECGEDINDCECEELDNEELDNMENEAYG